MKNTEMATEELDLNFGQNGVTAGESGDSLILDLEGVEEKSFEALPKGSYQAVVADMEYGDSNAGNPMITTTYEITEGEFQGRKLKDYWVLKGNGSEMGLVKLKKFISRLTPEVSLAGFSVTNYVENAIGIGRQCTIKLGVQKQKKGEYAGRVNNTIQEVDAAEGMF